MKAVLRRASRKDGSDPVAAMAIKAPTQRGKLSVDRERHACSWDGKPVALTVTEFLVLHALIQRPGIVKSRHALLDAVYDDHTGLDERAIDSHVKRIRLKFKQVDDTFNAIETLYGVCYRSLAE